MQVALYIGLGLAVLAVLGLVGLVFLGQSRRRITAGRLGRMARVGRLSARLSTSWFGAKLRRLVTRPSKRAAYDEARRKADAELVTRTMGQMKGAFMKLGQMMSFVGDGLPEEYRRAMASLQTSAPPMDFALLRDIAEHELGRPLERAFARFDEEPLAAASIGQVHRARLPSGREVAVKIQYPGVADAIRADLSNMAAIYRMTALMYPALDPKPVIAELKSRLGEELDYSNEAENQKKFSRLYRDHPYIRIPEVVDDYSTQMVLTSEYIDARRFDDVLADSDDERTRWGEILYRFVFGSIIRHGVFNGDPHPGNYLFDDDGRVVFLDFGCVKHFPDPMMDAWMRLVKAHLAGKPDEFHSLAVALGFLKSDAEIASDILYDYFGYFYEPFATDREFAFTREYNAKSLGMVFRPTGRFAGLQKRLNMPPDFVFVNRIQWGVYSILAALGAAGNWHAIHREYLFGDGPSTELGRIDATWRERRERDGGGTTG